jgi:DDE superfamily endonuclease/Helix-turn-helix of DDE superfamily endonuclease
MKWTIISLLQGKKFRRYTGIYRSVYNEMLTCLLAAKSSKRKHPTKGAPCRVSIENQLLMTVLYWREYRDQEHIALDYGVTQPTVSRIIAEVENILIKSGQFSIPGRKSLRTADGKYEVVIVDVTETPTERPKKKQKRKYSGKKKRHTLKSLFIIDAKSKEICFIAISNGSTHDFKMLKDSKLQINDSITILADLGFLGIKKLHSNSEIPHKNSKNHRLTEDEKQENKGLAKRRIVIEHVNRMMKIFLILKYPYRNKQKRFGLRVNLLAAIYNKNLKAA